MTRPTALGVSHDPKTPAWVGQGFGLAIESDFEILGFDRATLAGLASELESLPLVGIRRVPPEQIAAEWRAEGVRRLVERQYEDGRLMMGVDFHPTLGYRIEAPDHGDFAVSANGSSIACAPSQDWRWHRPFFAQALPLAASLNGMEVLHASGVEIGGRAVAFAGHSGAGKTSLAMHLVADGALLLADDVVAISVGPTGLLAHPGVRFASVVEEQLENLAADGHAALGPEVGVSEKRHVLVERLMERSAPFAALYFLELGGADEGLLFTRVENPDPRLLLSATFMSHIEAPARMTTQLDAYSTLARDVPVFTLRAPLSLSASDLAPLVAEHVRAGQ